MAKKGLVASFVKKSLANKNPGEFIKSTKLAQDAVTYIAPAIVGYVAARSVGRVARNYIGARVGSKWQRPIQILANALTLAGVWYAGSKFSSLSKYRAGLIAGAGIATAQSIIEWLMPKLNWAFDANTGYQFPPSDRAEAIPTSEYEDEVEEMRDGDESIPVEEVDGEEANDFQTGVFASN